MQELEAGFHQELRDVMDRTLGRLAPASPEAIEQALDAELERICDKWDRKGREAIERLSFDVPDSGKDEPDDAA